MCGPIASKPSKSEQDYRAESDFSTLQRAEEVRGDTSRHGRALAHGRKQVAAISRVMGKARAGRVSKRAPAGR